MMPTDEELRAHYASKHEVEVPRVQGVHFYGSEPEVTPATMRVTRYAKPEPRRTSNLEAVTCPHCLEQVIAHAYIKLRKVKA